MQWNIGLNDALSSPAKGISAALKTVVASFREVDAAALKAQAAMREGWKEDASGRMRDAAGKFVTSAQKSVAGVNGGGLIGALKSLDTKGMGSTIDDLQKKWSEFASTDVGAVFSAGAGIAVSAISAVAAAVATVTVALAAMGAAATVAFAKSAISAGIFRENSLISFEVLLKDKEAALRVYKDAVKMAGKTPFESQDIVDLYQKLLASGFKENELSSVATAIGDLGASKGMNKELMARLADSFGKMRSLGRLDGDMIQSLVSSGVNVGEVYAEIAKATGKSVDEVKKLQSQGKIDSTTAQAAILKVIQSSFGGTMDKLSVALAGLWSSLVSRPFELLNATFETKGGLNDWFETIKGAVKSFGDELDPEGKTGQKAISFANKIGDAFNGLTKIFLAFGTGFAKGFNESAPDASKIKGADIEQAVKAFSELGKVLGQVTGGIASVGAAITAMKGGWEAISATVYVVGGVILGLLIAIPAAFGGLLMLFPAAVLAIGYGLYKVGEFILGIQLAINDVAIGLGRKIGEALKGLDFGGFFASIGAALSSAASAAYGMAMGIGAQITAGIMAGLNALGASLQGAISSATGGISVTIPGTGGSSPSAAPSPTKEAAPAKTYNGEASVNASQLAPSSEAGPGSSGGKTFSVIIEKLVLGAGASAETAKADLTAAFLEIAYKLGYA